MGDCPVCQGWRGPLPPCSGWGQPSPAPHGTGVSWGVGAHREHIPPRHTRLDPRDTCSPSAARAEPECAEDPNPLKRTLGLCCELAPSSPDWEQHVPPAHIFLPGPPGGPRPGLSSPGLLITPVLHQPPGEAQPDFCCRVWF